MYKKIFIIVIIFFMIISLNACYQGIIPASGIDDESSENDGDNNTSIHSYLMIKGNSDIIKDCTPELIIFHEKENIVSMSFSGNSEDWSGWVDYSEIYDQFNLASGFYGTSKESGLKTIYVRFKDTDGIVFPKDSQNQICCNLEYEMQELFSIKIEPNKTEIKIGASQNFILRGYDLKLNEVPLDAAQVKWTKSCDVGTLNPTTGLHTTYTAPELSGVRNITAHYGSLGTGAKIYILQQ